MNSALLLHMRYTVINSVKSFVKKPLRLIIGIIAITYFIFLPFMFKDMIEILNLNNNIGFLIIYSVLTIYIMMPVTLSYFKRSGINFKKPDTNFMFATPIPPKQILFYGIFKQIYLQVVMMIIVTISAIFIFNLSPFLTILYFLISSVFSSFLDYSIAIIMYGSERISEEAKKKIKYFVYATLIIFTSLLAYTIAQKGFSVESIYSLIQSPLLIIVPIFGWKIGFASLMFTGFNVYNVISTVLYFLGSLLLLYIAYNMECTGEYYEDAMIFAEKQANIIKKQGKQSFLEAFGKKKKIHKVEANIKGSKAKVIFYKQLIEKRRSNRFFIKFSDLVFLVASIVGGIIFINDSIDANIFYATVCGLAMYSVIFFNQSNKWLEEFNHYFIYVIPDSVFSKLWYSTLLENLNNILKACFLTIPAGIIIGVSLETIILTIITQVAFQTMIVYKLILEEGYVGSKVGANIAQVISMFTTLLIMIIPSASLLLSFVFSVKIASSVIVTYCIVVSVIFIYLVTKVFVNIENVIKEN